MQGFGKNLNSKSDYLFIADKAINGEDSKERVLRIFQALLQTKSIYHFDKILKEGETVKESPLYKVVAQEQGGSIEQHQFVLESNPNGLIFKLGFTIEEIEKTIANLKEIK